jgi:branched-subunit amino acid aminotransferase/4-amino-4-deoxychorismate lyase
MTEIIWFEGKWTTTDLIPASALKRAWAYGELVFETFRSDAGRIPFLRQHAARIQHSLRLLNSAAVPNDVEALFQSWAEQAHVQSREPHLALRVNAYRGGVGLFDGAKEWSFFVLPRGIESAEIMALKPIQVEFLPYEKGLFPGRGGMKTSNYLPYLRGISDDANRERVLLGPKGQLLDGLRSHLLFELNSGEYISPREDKGMLRSLSRARGVEWLNKKGFSVIDGVLFESALQEVRFAWAGNSVWGYRPVSMLGGVSLPIRALMPVGEFWDWK